MQLQLVKRSETQQDNKIKEWMKVRYNEGWRIGVVPTSHGCVLVRTYVVKSDEGGRLWPVGDGGARRGASVMK